MKNTSTNSAASMPSLTWNFNNNIFPAATIDSGPQTVCYDHLDPGNKAAGWCDITSTGPFDYKGGHLILLDIDKIIDMPYSIQPHERRVGFTQYAAGGLFRWVDNGFCKSEEVGPELRARRLQCVLKICSICIQNSIAAGLRAIVQGFLASSRLNFTMLQSCFLRLM
jgi:hypothetical protein